MFMDTAEELARTISNKTGTDEATQVNILTNALEVEKKTRDIVAKYSGWQRILMILLVWEKQHGDAATRLKLLRILNRSGYYMKSLKET